MGPVWYLCVQLFVFCKFFLQNYVEFNDHWLCTIIRLIRLFSVQFVCIKYQFNYQFFFAYSCLFYFVNYSFCQVLHIFIFYFFTPDTMTHSLHNCVFKSSAFFPNSWLTFSEIAICPSKNIVCSSRFSIKSLCFLMWSSRFAFRSSRNVTGCYVSRLPSFCRNCCYADVAVVLVSVAVTLDFFCWFLEKIVFYVNVLFREKVLLLSTTIYLRH